MMPLGTEITLEKDENWVLKGSCQDCNWKGTLDKCDSYIEQESWEMPWIEYRVYICPKCNGEDVWVDYEYPDEEGEING